MTFTLKYLYFILDVSGAAGPNDFVLDVTYRDFSVTHDDFTGYAGNSH